MHGDTADRAQDREDGIGDEPCSQGFVGVRVSLPIGNQDSNGTTDDNDHVSEENSVGVVAKNGCIAMIILS